MFGDLAGLAAHGHLGHAVLFAGLADDGDGGSRNRFGRACGEWRECEENKKDCGKEALKIGPLISLIVSAISACLHVFSHSIEILKRYCRISAKENADVRARKKPYLGG
jgi:hypothetical protein